MVWCYAIQPENLELIAPLLDKLDEADWNQGMVKGYLAHYGATKNDFYDSASGLLYPEHVNFNRITNEIKGVAFYNKGLKNDPADNFPARIKEFPTKIKLQFFKNGEEWQHSYLKDSYRWNQAIIPSALQENYKDLSAFLDDSKSIIALPFLRKEHSVMILKNQ